MQKVTLFRLPGLVFLLLGSLQPLFLQGQVVHLGPKIAGQSVWLLNQNNYGLSEMDYQFKGGLAYGAFIGVDYGDHWGVELEFQFSHLGQDYEDNIGLQLILGTNDVFTVRKEVDLVYSQVPLMARYRNGGERANFVAMLGPQLGVRGKATLRYYADGDSIPFAVLPAGLYPSTTNADDFFESFDFGLAGGVGGEYYFGDVFFMRTMFRFYTGFSDINAEVTRDAPEYAATRNFSMAVEVGMGVRLGQQPGPTWRRTPGH